MGMFTIHLASYEGRPTCGAYSEHVNKDSKNVDCRECLEARIAEINKELKEMDELDEKLKNGELEGEEDES
jgi:hypothetical protein